MRRSDLEHLIRAAGRIAGERELIIIGSQSVLGQFPDAPVALLKIVRGRIERDFSGKPRV